MANRLFIFVLLITLGTTYGRLKLRKNSFGVNVGFQLPAPGSKLLGALAHLPLSVQYLPSPLRPPPFHQHHPEATSDGHGQPEIHHHHHHHPNTFGHSIVGPEFGGFGNEIGYNEVYRR